MNPAEVIPFEDKGNKKIRVGNSPIVSNCPVYDLFHTQQDPLLMRYWVHQYATWLFPRESCLGCKFTMKMDQFCFRKLGGWHRVEGVEFAANYS